MRRLLVLAAFLFALSTTGCGDSPSTGKGPNAAPTGEGNPGGNPVPPPKPPKSME